MSEDGWRDYYRNTRARPPRPLTLKALPHVPSRNQALDLGAGALNDSRYLLAEGFAHVTALDQTPVAAEAAATLPQPRFRYDISRMEDYAFPPSTFDLVTAQFSLPFIPPDQFDRVFILILASLAPGGVLSANCFGDRDAWAGNPQMNFHSSADITRMLAPCTVLHFYEEEAERPTAAGVMKHWHIFDWLCSRIVCAL